MPECVCCVSPVRADIDACLSRGESVRLVASRYGLSKSAVGRHREHLLKREARGRREALSAIAVDRADVARSPGTRLERLLALEARVGALLDSHEDNAGAVLACARVLRELIAEQREESGPENGIERLAVLPVQLSPEDWGRLVESNRLDWHPAVREHQIGGGEE